MAATAASTVLGDGGVGLVAGTFTATAGLAKSKEGHQASGPQGKLMTVMECRSTRVPT
jgi:hypothetical protein